METTATSNGGTPNVATIRANRGNAKIERMVLSGPTQSKCRIYMGAVTELQYRDGSNNGQQDTAEYPNGLYWPNGQQLFAVWDTAGLFNIYVSFVNA